MRASRIGTESCSGTRYVTATGNSLGCGLANLARIAAVSRSISSGIVRTLALRASRFRSNCSRSGVLNSSSCW